MAGANIPTIEAERGMAAGKDAAQLGDARPKQGATNIPAVFERTHRVPQARLFVQCPGAARAHQWGPGVRCHRVAVSELAH